MKPVRPIVLSTSAEERSRTYVAALVAAGARADEIRVVYPAEGIGAEAALENAAALVLCGGEDVDPSRYGEAVWDASVYVNPRRDALEFDLIAIAEQRQLPVLGVCRGLQILNVHFGGSLWQDLPSQRPSAIDHSITSPFDAIAHDVAAPPVVPQHPFARHLATGLESDARVNSRHHQGIKALGAGLQVAGSSPDGLVEAFTLQGDWWVAAVQWHPENLVQKLSPQLDLWRDFLATARAHGDVHD
jgi:gamma-glutamyl-gamma-aminobutyrate hydrolase PuuD